MANFPAVSILLLYYAPVIFELSTKVLANPKCDAETFYLPYVHVKRKKNGAPLAALRSSGFIDLRYKSRVTLCINGAVIIYSDVERLDPDAKLTAEVDKSKDSLSSAPEARFPSPEHDVNQYEFVPGEELRFKKGELFVFTHKCISVNKVPLNVLKKMKEEQDRNVPELMPDTQVTGKLALGIYLIASKDGYDQPELGWFKGANWDYIMSRDKTVKETSFVVVGTNASHCLKLPDGSQVKVVASPNVEYSNGSGVVCKWTPKEEDKYWYAKYFQRGYDTNGVPTGDPRLTEEDYEVGQCSEGDSDRNIILTMSKTTPAPVSHVNFAQHDPFSIFNPNVWTNHGFRKDTGGISGGDEREEDKAMNIKSEDMSVPCSLDPVGCEDGGEMEITTLKDMQNVDEVPMNGREIYAEDCVALPTFDIAECCGQGNNGNRLLELALELEPAHKCAGEGEEGEGDEAAAPPPSGEGEDAGGKAEWPKCKNLGDDKDLSWKMEILCLVAEIFQHLCMPFRPEMPAQVARVFGWYVFKAHMYGENMGRVGPPPGNNATPELSSQFDHVIHKPYTWYILEKELQRCRTVAKSENGGKGLKFQWEVGLSNTGRWKVPATGETTKKRKKREAATATTNPKKMSRIRPDPITYQKMSKRSQEVWDEIEREERSQGPATNRTKKLSEQKVLRRQKRDFKTDHVLKLDTLKIPGLSTKYHPGKTITPTYSDGIAGFVREVIQEYRRRPNLNDPRADSAKYSEYPENVHHCRNPGENPVTKQVVCSKTQELFYYEDRAENEFDFNIAIDFWWKIWATVIGYCNKAYRTRKSETFPRLYNSKYEYFFDLVMKEWKCPEDNEALKYIFSEIMSEESQVWLDTCLEAAYVDSDSPSFRPPRPMTITDKDKEISNFFEEIPGFIYYRYHAEPLTSG